MIQRALLLIDLQRSFCAPDGIVARQGHDIGAMTTAARRCARYAARARAAGIEVIWTRIGWAADYSDGGRLIAVQRPNLARIGALKRGSDDHAIVPVAGYVDGEMIIDKTRFSALTNAYMIEHLMRQSIDTVFVAGVTTSMCVESTVRDLAERDYSITVLADGCADFTPDSQQASLRALGFGFATIYPPNADPPF